MSGNTTQDVENGTTNENGGNSVREKETEIFLYGTKKLMVFTILLALAVSLLDALFFYIPVMKNDDRKCISLDKKLETTVISLRSLVDLLYAIYIVARLRCDFFSPCYRKYKIASKYSPPAFPLDFLSALPLPQVALLIVVPTMMKGSRFLKAIYLLRSVVLCQYVPRVFTTYRLLTSGHFVEPAKARAMVTAFIFILAINGIGGLWYFLSMERLVQCWDKACENHVGCLNLFRCNDNNVGNHTFLNDFCPRDAQKTDFFDFGIFSDAIQSRVVETTDFLKKFVYSFHWSLLSLSCFGQNLETSTYVWENILAISITISGLFLFLFLLGNLQAYLQAMSIRQEKKRRQAQEMEQWKPFERLPEHLKSKVRGSLRHNWLETVGDDMEKFLNKLPEPLRREIKVELYLKWIEKMPLFEKMEKSSLEPVCHRLSEVNPDGTYVIHKGKEIDGMLFIMHGRLSVDDGRFDLSFLKHGDLCGEELLSWVLLSTTSSHPLSSINVRAVEKVQALSLKADDLKSIAAECRWRERTDCNCYLRERQQAQEMEHWNPFKRVPKDLKLEVQKLMHYDWLGSVGDDMDKFLDKLPKDLCQRIKVELYFELLEEVPLFRKMDKSSLEAMCHRLSIVFYPGETDVISMGKAIDRMLFIEDGELMYTDDGNDYESLKRGFCGEELLSWALDSNSSTLPLSNKDVNVCEDVQALSLKADDLKSVAAQFGWHDHPECQRYLVERQQAQEMEDWMPFRMVPKHLKSKVRRFMCYDWRETVGDDMDKFLDKLPEGLRQRIKVELYSKLKEVPLFGKMDKSSLEAMCHCLSAVFYPKGTDIIRMGKAIDRMLFIEQGELMSTKDGLLYKIFERGDFYGEELLSWALDSTTSPTLPLSNTDVKAFENVQALSLKADDLKSVAAQFEWRKRPECHRYLMERWQAQKMERWKPFKRLPEHRKFEVRKIMHYDWLETVGNDMDKFLDKLPEVLRQDIKVELYSKLVKKVPLFRNMDELSLAAMCHRLSVVFYSDETNIIRMGEEIDRMLFIEHGDLMSTEDGNFYDYLERGFCGEELLSWALDSTSSSTLPLSNRDVKAFEDVQALSLKAGDLKSVATLFGWPFNPECVRYLMERQKIQEMERWKAFKRVPELLKLRLLKFMPDDWLETVGDDIDKFLDKLPEGLRQRIKVELYFDLLEEVPPFEKLDEKSLRAMCGHLSAVFYPEGHYASKMGEAIDRMFFIVHGSLSVDDGCSGSASLTHGDFYGEELLSWALDSTFPALPRSSRDVIAREDVQALSLKAEHLKKVVAQFDPFDDVEDSQQGRQQITNTG